MVVTRYRTRREAENEIDIASMMSEYDHIVRVLDYELYPNSGIVRTVYAGEPDVIKTLRHIDDIESTLQDWRNDSIMFAHNDLHWRNIVWLNDHYTIIDLAVASVHQRVSNDMQVLEQSCRDELI